MKKEIRITFFALMGMFVMSLCFAGCGTPQPPKDLNVKSILRPETFPAEQRAAIQASVEQLKLDGESPAEFYADAKVDIETNGILVIHLWHQSAFLPEYLHSLGNPGGECRDFYYDTNKKKITEKLFWQ